MIIYCDVACNVEVVTSGKSSLLYPGICGASKLGKLFANHVNIDCGGWVSLNKGLQQPSPASNLAFPFRRVRFQDDIRRIKLFLQSFISLVLPEDGADLCVRIIPSTSRHGVY
jgi:hypothetical protein